MKIIRRGVFETNSSSTHSISIYKWTPTKESPIPSDSIIDVKGTISAQTEIKDEVGKLNYIVCMLASLVEKESWACDKFVEAEFSEMIQSKRFSWLSDVVKDRCNTDINYVCNNNIFPYFETVCDDNCSIADVLECDIDDEFLFKKRVREIIFDENYIIEDKENEW